MDIEIADLRAATVSEWKYIWEDCDYATYFHSHEWAMIWQKYTRGKTKPMSTLITFSDGRNALLPFSRQSVFLGWIKRYISSPAGTFGGWLSLDELSAEHGRLLYEHILANHPNLIWRLNPFDSIAMNIKSEVASPDQTQVLSLDRGFSAIYKDWTKGHSSAVRKAQKLGVEIREADSTQDWKDYYCIYEDSIRRWGSLASSAYRWSLFQCMSELLSPNIKLWLATYGGKVVSGALCFYAKRHVVYWHGAALSEFFNLRPVNMLLYRIIEHACNNGYQWFDFNPSGGHESVSNFKKSFGAQFRSAPVITRSSPSLLFLQNLLKMKTKP